MPEWNQADLAQFPGAQGLSKGEIPFGVCPSTAYIWALLIESNEEYIMARRCVVTGKGPRSGHSISHAHNLSKRRWLPNLQTKRIYIPEEGRWVKLKVSAKALKTIDKKGISAVIKDLRAKGVKV